MFAVRHATVTDKTLVEWTEHLPPLREDHPVLQRTFSPAEALRLQLPASSRDRAIRGILDRNSVESPSHLRIPAAIGRF